jgi:hypothetical protein
MTEDMAILWTDPFCIVVRFANCGLGYERFTMEAKLAYF